MFEAEIGEKNEVVAFLLKEAGDILERAIGGGAEEGEGVDEGVDEGEEEAGHELVAEGSGTNGVGVVDGVAKLSVDEEKEKKGTGAGE